MEKENIPQENNVITIKKLLETKKITIGADKVIKGLKDGTIKKVFVAKNIKSETKNDLEHYTNLTSVEMISLPITNDELGIICKKPFNISVLGQI